MTARARVTKQKYETVPKRKQVGRFLVRRVRERRYPRVRLLLLQTARKKCEDQMFPKSFLQHLHFTIVAPHRMVISGGLYLVWDTGKVHAQLGNFNNFTLYTAE